MISFDQPIVLSISSRFENIEIVQLVCDDVCRSLGFDSETTYQVGLAMREGVANAMKHGNRFDESRTVEVRFTRSGDTLRIEIEDEGEGFDPGRVPDPRAPENLLRTSGRGLLYIDTFMDVKSYRFEEGKGTVLVMEKKLESAGEVPRTGEETGR